MTRSRLGLALVILAAVIALALSSARAPKAPAPSAPAVAVPVPAAPVSAELVAAAPQPAWEAEIRQKLARKVTFDFVDMPLEDAMNFMRNLSKVTMVIDPKVMAPNPPAPIKLRVSDMSLDLALEWILKLDDLHYVLCDNALFISAGAEVPTPAVAVAQPKAVDQAVAKADEQTRAKLVRKLTFDFVETPLSEIVGFMATLTKENIILTPAARAKNAPITLHVADMQLDQALKWVLRLADLDYRIENGTIVIDVPAAKQPAASKDKPGDF